MVHGQPDYGPSAAKATVASISDMAELAVRLGSIVTFDRLGDIVSLDSFESGLSGVDTAGGGTGYSVSQDAEHARNGGFSAKMVCGSDGLRTAVIMKYLPYPVLANLGMEISFTMHTDISLLIVSIQLYNGTQFLEGYLKFDEDNSKLQYYDSAGAEQDLETDLALYKDPDLFHTIKLVVDFVNNKYVRALLNEHSWDMSDYDLYSTASAINPHIILTVYAKGAAAANATIHVDDLIVTQNEPA